MLSNTLCLVTSTVVCFYNLDVKLYIDSLQCKVTNCSNNNGIPPGYLVSLFF